MKKNKNILGFVVLLGCLLVCIIMVKLIYKNNRIIECENIDYNDILVEINTATNNMFFSEDNISFYIPLVLSSESDYMFAINKQTKEEYFIIVKNISEKDLSELKSLVDITNANETTKTLEIKENRVYTYLISSENFSSTMDGIIRSYIYCK